MNSGGSFSYVLSNCREDIKKKELIENGSVSDGGRDEPDPRDYVYEDLF